MRQTAPHTKRRFRRGHRNTIMLLLLTGVAFCAVPVSAALGQEAGSCETIARDFQKSLDSKNLAGLRAALNRARDPASQCRPGYAYCLGRRGALGALEMAYARSRAGESDAALKPLLTQALSMGTPWQVLFAAAEAEEAGDKSDAKRYDRAARHYQSVLEELSLEPICPGEQALRPSGKEAALLFERTALAQLLSEEFVDPPRYRCGEDDYGWLFSGAVCGYAPKSRPLPLQFRYGSAEFTHKGERTAAFLLDYLKKKRVQAIRLTGHTDTKGSETYNLRLSRQRLEAVKKFLAGGGYAGAVTLEPKGESIPFALTDPGRYSGEEIDRINRRVELYLAVE